MYFKGYTVGCRVKGSLGTESPVPPKAGPEGNLGFAWGLESVRAPRTLFFTCWTQSSVGPPNLGFSMVFGSLGIMGLRT